MSENQMKRIAQTINQSIQPDDPFMKQRFREFVKVTPQIKISKKVRPKNLSETSLEVENYLHKKVLGQDKYEAANKSATLLTRHSWCSSQNISMH